MAEPRDPVAFPTLSDEQIESLRARGEEATLEPGDSLWDAGDREFCFFVVLEGLAQVQDTSCGDVQVVAEHGPGEFSGDVDLMTGRPAPVGCVATERTRVLKLSAEELREVVRVDQDLGALLLLAFMRRRQILLNEEGHGAILVGSRFDPKTQKIREFLGRNRVLHQWRETEDPDNREYMRSLGLRPSDFPIVMLDGKRLVQPSLEDLGERLGVRQRLGGREYDLVIVGAGPAGLAAAVYGASEGLHTLLLDRAAPGGQAGWSSRIENYMGFPEGLSGNDLAARGLMQAEKFGAELSVPSEVKRIECGRHGHRVVLTGGEEVDARAVLVATGANYQKLDVPGFERYESSGIYYAATGLEAGFCTDEEVVVVGAGNSAGQAAVFLSGKCKRVHLIVRGDRLNKSMSDYLSYRVEQIPNIEVNLQSEVERVEGDGKIERVYLKGERTGCVPCAGLFVFIGAEPNTGFLRETVTLDEKGFVLTGELIRDGWTERREPFYLETSCPGVLAAGDCRVGSVKRVAASVGEGSMAITFVHRILAQ